MVKSPTGILKVGMAIGTMPVGVNPLPGQLELLAPGGVIVQVRFTKSVQPVVP